MHGSQQPVSEVVHGGLRTWAHDTHTSGYVRASRGPVISAWAHNTHTRMVTCGPVEVLLFQYQVEPSKPSSNRIRGRQWSRYNEVHKVTRGRTARKKRSNSRQQNLAARRWSTQGSYPEGAISLGNCTAQEGQSYSKAGGELHAHSKAEGKQGQQQTEAKQSQPRLLKARST